MAEIESSGKIRFSEYAQTIRFVFSTNQIRLIWREVRESRTSGVGQSQSSRSLLQARRIVGSGDENGLSASLESTKHGPSPWTGPWTGSIKLWTGLHRYHGTGMLDCWLTSPCLHVSELRIPTAHDFRVISARSRARARTIITFTKWWLFQNGSCFSTRKRVPGPKDFFLVWMQRSPFIQWIWTSFYSRV